MEINDEQKGLVIQACAMQINTLFEEYGEELVDISPDIITKIFAAGIQTAINSIEAII